jgi:hypothetical protein
MANRLTSKTVAQAEDILYLPTILFLMLRSTRSGRLEARTIVMQHSLSTPTRPEREL